MDHIPAVVAQYCRYGNMYLLLSTAEAEIDNAVPSFVSMLTTRDSKSSSTSPVRWSTCHLGCISIQHSRNDEEEEKTHFYNNVWLDGAAAATSYKMKLNRPNLFFFFLVFLFWEGTYCLGANVKNLKTGGRHSPHSCPST